MKLRYRITKWRHDVPAHTYAEPEFEGATAGACDEQALKRFKELADDPNNGYDGMSISRIDVVEKVTFLAKNGRQEGG